MKTEQELLEEVGKLHKNFTDAVDKMDQERKDSGASTAETRGLVEELTLKISDPETGLYKQIDDLRAKLAAPPAPDPDQMSDEQRTHHEGMGKWLRRGMKHGELTPEERRALTEASDTDGAFFAPTEMEAGIQMNASNIAVMRNLVNVGTTSRQSVVQGLLSKPIVGWGSEKLAVPKQILEAGADRLDIYDLKALYTISNDTLDDSDADIVGELSMAFGRVIAEQEDIVIAAGSGFKRPQGFSNYTAAIANFTKTSVAAALSDATYNGMDALISCLTALKGTYRMNSTWVFNSATMGLIMQFKDSYGQYLWQPSKQEGAPTMLLGRPTAVNEGMPDVAAGAFPICLADFQSGYKLRDRTGLAIKRLDELYAEYDQVGFIVKKRVGGKPNKPEAYQFIKVAA